MFRRRPLVVVALLHVVALSVPACRPQAPSPDVGVGAPSGPGMNSPQPADTLDGQSLDVRIEAMTGDRPAAADDPRNPFRFGPGTPAGGEREPLDMALTPVAAGRGSDDRAPAAPPSGGAAVVGAASLKFIGVLEAPESVGLIAVLSDGDYVYHGRVNEVIEGRYRIVRIDVASIEIEFLQGGGRQTLRLAGS